MLADTAHRIPRAKPAESRLGLARSTTVDGDSGNGRSRTLLCQNRCHFYAHGGRLQRERLLLSKTEQAETKQKRMLSGVGRRAMP
jgi:hypothetical protein